MSQVAHCRQSGRMTRCILGTPWSLIRKLLERATWNLFSSISFCKMNTSYLLSTRWNEQFLDLQMGNYSRLTQFPPEYQGHLSSRCITEHCLWWLHSSLCTAIDFSARLNYLALPVWLVMSSWCRFTLPSFPFPEKSYTGSQHLCYLHMLSMYVAELDHPDSFTGQITHTDCP